ncbi:hypothetical protein FHS16_001730 [Paenibacillus endophyticus]|uniref:PhiEco32-like amidoligase-type 2 protein n=1 Tax=Paenibacillus endophyticus TaxID=1294268 RepID=A0A7W5C7U1_9BACL|nr:hypothetical protein [Paenibacillus endophyticus]MBB3151684.1 hypothetical protein [Paenibacillus endophyticus]
MASTWVWRGSYDRLEKVEANREKKHLSGERNGQPLHAESWTEVKPGDAVLAWTQNRSIDANRFKGAWVLNLKGHHASSLPYAEKERIWRRAGLSGGSPLDSERLFRVCIIHLEPVELQRIDASGKAMQGKPLLQGNAGAWPDDPALRRVVRTAVAALYALGLDIGEAEVGLGGDGRTAVRDAWPMLRDTRQEAAVLRRFAAWHAAAGAGAVDRQLLIGADPEFVLVTPEGKIASASRFFGAGVGGAAGTDALLVGRRLLYPVAELRPEPAEDPAALAANVRRLLLRAAERISDPALRWAAGAMPVPGLALGGHIHLSGAPLTSRLLRLLDSYAAFPLALVEDPAGRARRPRYGMLGDFRLQPHGGFEYRTLPSWLVSPAAAKAAFALALLCAREEHNLTYIPALDERYMEAYYSGDRTELAGCLDQAAGQLGATTSYAAYASYIEPLLDAARRGMTWDESADLRVKWRMPH